MRALLQPLNLAALLTWSAVALSTRVATPAHTPWVWLLLVAFLVAMLADGLPRVRRSRFSWAPMAVEALTALGVCALSVDAGAAPVLLVILAAQLSMTCGLRVAVGVVALLDLALFMLLLRADHPQPVMATAVYAGFQGFAMVIGHANRVAEDARDALARVNADLLATRALLADSARDAERLRVARELHDVAGHTLTALNLNLRVLASDRVLAARAELALSQRLASDLMGQIRDVVHALRDTRGLDLGTALRALAAPMPALRIDLSIDDDVLVHDLATADVVLRMVQEALTNAVRHADARTLRVVIAQGDQVLRVSIEDDGSLRGTLREGNGLTGMRERVESLGGRVEYAVTARGGLCIEAGLPA
jgi:signal transduction histidine kinase